MEFFKLPITIGEVLVFIKFYMKDFTPLDFEITGNTFKCSFTCSIINLVFHVSV